MWASNDKHLARDMVGRTAHMSEVKRRSWAPRGVPIPSRDAMHPRRFWAQPHLIGDGSGDFDRDRRIYRRILAGRRLYGPPRIRLLEDLFGKRGMQLVAATMGH